MVSPSVTLSTGASPLPVDGDARVDGEQLIDSAANAISPAIARRENASWWFAMAI
jgi:hypothetical protein